jgi:hypothetical protein
MKNKNIFMLCMVLFGIYACETKPPVEKTEEHTAPIVYKKAPVFNEDSAYEYIHNQVKFGPRVPNSKAHKACGKYLIDFLRAQGAVIYTQKFEAKAYDGKQLELTNIIASFNIKQPKRVIIASHWDTRPFADQDDKDTLKAIDGANDGASGVGVIMEIARVLKQAKEQPEIGIDLILFDGEDYGEPSFYTGKHYATSWCLGSQYWSDHKHMSMYKAYYGILLDMVGAKGASFAKEGVSMEYAPTVVNTVWSHAKRIGYGHVFKDIVSPGIIDDHTFVNEHAMIPMIDIIEYEPSNGNYFGSYWHTHDDNINVIDKTTLKAVGQTLLETLYNEKVQ